MLSFFRRIVRSKVGVVVTLVVLGLIALAFAAGDVTGLGHDAGTLAGNSAIRAGDHGLAEADLRAAVTNDYQGFRQQQPTLDMAGFLAGGGYEASIERATNSLALDAFAADQKLLVGKRAIDGQIASYPAFRGLDGKFSQQVYQQILATNRLSELQLRRDVASEIVQRQLTAPTLGAMQVPDQLAQPYAALLLEKRSGIIGFIPAAAVPAGAAPTEAEIATFYTRNRTRYSVPERRIARYALVTPEQVKARAAPSEAEVAAAYRQQAARFAAREQRDLKQVIVADQAAATALAAKVKAGTAIDAAASAIDLEAAPLAAMEKAAYARLSSPAAAEAAFAAPQGTVVGPVRTALGWAVVQVAKVSRIAGKSLDQARGELTTELTARKTTEALATLHDGIDDGIGKGSTFAELVADNKLAVTATPPLTAAAVNPDDAAFKPDPATTAIMTAAYGAEQGDEPQLVTTAQDGSFALVTLDRVQPAAPRPLAQIRDVVVRDVQLDRAQAAARRIAIDVVARANKGMPLAQALGTAGVKLPAPKPIGATRAQLAAAQGRVPPPLALMFSMTAKSAKMLEAPGNSGWYVVALDQIVPGVVQRDPQIAAMARAGLGQSIGREYVEQFATAVRGLVGVKKDDAAIARVKAELAGNGDAAQ